MLGGLTLLSLQLAGSGAAVAPPAGQAAPAAEIQQVRDEELILFAVTLDNLTLTESLTAYGNIEDPFLPVGELARLLDLDIDVFPSERRITGSLGEAARALTIDLGAGLARMGGNDIALAREEVAISRTDIFIRASALQRALPVIFKVEPEALQIGLTATEKLPVQSRLERSGRIQGLSRDVGSNEPVLLIETPYRLYSPPAFDFTFDTGVESRTGRFARRYDIRAAGDLLYAGFNAYLGSDEMGGPATTRLEFERRSAEGGLLGPLDATYVAAGDVFTPALPLGPRSGAGRGFSFTTAKLERASVFQRTTLRGELPVGFDVELYINDVLRSGQRSPVGGRYEFLEVPLVQGLNVIRIVTYGPRGERAEQTRVLNVGGGQLPEGEISFDVGLVQQERALVPIRAIDSATLARAGYGELRAVVSAAYGLSPSVTLVGGAALYPSGDDDRRTLVNLGARGSLFGMAVQGDIARDLDQGMAVALGFAGQPLGVSLVARHAEYSGGFLDETSRAFDLTRPLQRHSEINIDMSLPPIGGKTLPLSLRAERNQFKDGGSSWLALTRVSTTLANTLLSTGLDYLRTTTPAAETSERLSGNIAASRFVDYKWQLRGVVDFDLIPSAEIRSLSVTADRSLSETLAMRLGLGKSFGSGSELNLQGGASLRLPFADLSFTADYATKAGEYQLGLRLAFGVAHDPGTRRYRPTRPGPAGGGSASFHAFTDSNANGVYDAGEAPAAGIKLDGGERRIVTGANGRAFITGLGDSVSSRIRADLDNIDAFFVTSPPQNIDFSPRPGNVVEIVYPLTPVAEVLARIQVAQANGNLVGVSGVRVQLLRDGAEASAEPAEVSTEFDGSAIFNNLPPGSYRLALEPEQAARLKMRLKAPVGVTVGADGVAGDIEAELIFEGNQD